MNNDMFTPYQYAIIRYIHDTTTNEFLNIGVALFAPSQNYFKINITTKYRRITDTFFDADGELYRNYVNKILRRYENIIKDWTISKTKLFPDEYSDIEKILRIFLRKESSFQYSSPSSGISPMYENGLDETFDRLFSEYVEKYIKAQDKETRNEEEIWRTVYRPKLEKTKNNVYSKLEPKDIETKVEKLSYDHAWKNGRWHLLQPISFDLVRPASIIEKAHRNVGRNYLLNSSNEVSHLYLLLGQPRTDDEIVIEKYNQAKDIITANDFSYELKLIEENEADDFAEYLSSKIDH